MRGELRASPGKYGHPKHNATSVTGIAQDPLALMQVASASCKTALESRHLQSPAAFPGQQRLQLSCNSLTYYS